MTGCGWDVFKKRHFPLTCRAKDVWFRGVECAAAPRLQLQSFVVGTRRRVNSSSRVLDAFVSDLHAPQKGVSCQRLMHHTIVLTFSFNEVFSKNYEICCRKRLLSIRGEKLATVLHQHMNQCYTCCRCYTCKPRRCRNSWTFRAFLLGKLTAWLHGQMMVFKTEGLNKSPYVNDSIKVLVMLMILLVSSFRFWFYDHLPRFLLASICSAPININHINNIQNFTLIKRKTAQINKCHPIIYTYFNIK